MTLWLVQAAYPFSSVTANGWSVAAAPGEPTHFCPVFLDKETAEKWSEGRFPVVPLMRALPPTAKAIAKPSLAKTKPKQ